MQRIEAGAVVLADTDVLRLARLAVAGLPVVARRDGVLMPEDQRLVADLDALSRQVRARIERQTRRPAPSPGTKVGPADLQAASSAPSTWPSTSEAAAAYGVDESYLRRLARQRRLTARQAGRGGWEFEPASLAAWAIGRTRTT